MGRNSRCSKRQHLIIAFAAMLGLLVGGIAKTEAASYTFTKISDTADDFSSFSGPPAVNDSGLVAFSARLDSGPSGIFTGDGTSPRTIADTTGPFSFLSPLPSLSDSGIVAFRAFLKAGGHTIVRTDGSTPTTIATTNPIAQPGRAFRFLGNPSVNDDGTVAFHGLDATGSGIFTSDTTTPIAHRPGVSPSFDDNLSVADGGAVAFVAFDATGRGIFRSDGTMIAHTSGPLFKVLGVPSLNSEGAVAFWAMLDAGGDGIFVSNGTMPTTIADSTGPFNSFGNSASINDKGVVAFWASLDDGRHGIFTGPDPGAHKVIAAGDTLDGPTVTFLTFGPEGLNNSGAVAFVATLADGTRAVYRADPAPSDVRVSLDIKPGGNPNMINLKSQGTVPIAILTTDDFDATTVNPTTVTLAGAHVKLKKNGMPMAAYEDVNGDGRADLVLHVSTQYLQLDESSMVAVLAGQTYDGTAITGSDTVRIVP